MEQWRTVLEENGSSLAEATQLEPLFSPFALGSMTLPNRFVMAPMTRSFSPRGIPGPDVAAYYRRRAEGGVGLIVTEGTWIPHPSASNEASAPNFHGEQALAGWRKVAEEVHAAGGLIVPQLWHAGLMHKLPTAEAPQGTPPEPQHLGPSGLSGGWPLVQDRPPMSLADIDAIIEAFGTAAASAYQLGFDGVEIHGAHGYLIDQFLWHHTNRRTDRYGGGHADRATFAAEIVAEVRRRTALDFPILFRMSQWKSHDYEARIADTPAELEALMTPIAEAGVDLFDCSQRRFWEPAFEGSDHNLSGWMRKLTGKPTMTVGSVGLDTDLATSVSTNVQTKHVSLDKLLQLFERGDFDLVGIGRSVLADARWVEKARAGRMEEAEMFSVQSLGILA